MRFRLTSAFPLYRRASVWPGCCFSNSPNAAAASAHCWRWNKSIACPNALGWDQPRRDIAQEAIVIIRILASVDAIFLVWLFGRRTRFRHGENLVGLHVFQILNDSARPANMQQFYRVSRSQSKMNSHIAG